MTATLLIQRFPGQTITGYHEAVVGFEGQLTISFRGMSLKWSNNDTTNVAKILLLDPRVLGGTTVLST